MVPLNVQWGLIHFAGDCHPLNEVGRDRLSDAAAGRNIMEGMMLG